MNGSYDIAIVGSGFAGSLLAMIARRLGLTVVLLERGRHPRFMIGESSTPLSNLLLEELATRYDLPAVKPLAKWGSWRQHYPDVACGLKRGFTFYHHALGQPDPPDPEHRNQLLVAASPHDRIGDTHWFRADFDALLLGQAQSLGAELVDEIRLNGFIADDSGATLEGQKDGRQMRFRARFVVDASGTRGFLQRALALPEAELEGYPGTQALYSHFSGVKRMDEIEPQLEMPPYPVDDAAVHHIFEGGWIWVLRFSNGLTSAGVAAMDRTADTLRFVDGKAAWDRLLSLMPSLKEQFGDARAVQPFMHVPRLSFLSGAICGARWAMLPSAAGFVDPLLSTGFPLTLLGIGRLGKILEEDGGPERFAASLHCYAAKTHDELQATARLIGALYANMSSFPVFTALSLLYFAAASFSETARRLKKPELASSFLLHDHPTFGPACRELLTRSRHVKTDRETTQFIADVKHAIGPIDVAGLCRDDRRNWYPVDAEDLFRSAEKVGATHEEISRMLESCGFHAIPV